MTIRGQILSMQEIPSIGKVYGLVKQEKKQRINVKDKASYTSNVIESAHQAKYTYKEKGKGQSFERGRYSKSRKKLNTNLFCENCNYYGHIKANFYHFVGFLEKKRNDGNKNKEED